MNTILTALKSDIAKVIYASIFVASCFIIPNAIGNCTTPEPIVVDRYQQAVDSMRAILRTQERLKLDSANNVSEKKISALNKKISDRDKKIIFFKTENENLIDRYENDPDLAKCDSIVDNQKKIILNQDTLIKDLKEDVKEYSSLVSNLKQEVVYVEVDKKEAIKDLKIEKATTKELYNQLTKNKKQYKFWKGVLQTAVVVEGVLLLIKN